MAQNPMDWSDAACRLRLLIWCPLRSRWQLRGLRETGMILDLLTILFFVGALLLIYRMVAQRRRDVLHGKYLQRSRSRSLKRRHSGRLRKVITTN